MPSQDQLNLQSYSRPFLQPGGTSPANAPLFYGIETQLCAVGDVTFPQGTVAPINVWNPTIINAFLLVGRTLTPPDLPTYDLTLYEKIGPIPRFLDQQVCDLTTYVVVGNCKDPSNFALGWNYVLILPNGKTETTRIGARGALPAGSAALEDTLSLKLGGNPYVVGGISFGELDNTTVTKEIKDVIYGAPLACGNCGVSNDGTKWIYSIEIGSGGAKPLLVYSVDGGATFTATTITAAAADEVPNAIVVAGSYLVVLSPTAGNGTTLGGYYYATLNQYTGVPSAFTKVTGGFVASKNGRDAWAVTEKEIWIVGDGGYIYKISTIGSAPSVVSAAGATTSNLARVMAQGQTIVAVGATGAVVISNNRGVTFGTTPAAPSATSLQAVDVRSDFRFFVGDSAGAAWYTVDGGNTWTSMTMPTSFVSGGGAFTGISDIVFITDEVGYILGNCIDPSDIYMTNTLGVLAVTIDGGERWWADNATARVLNWPSFFQGDRLAVPLNAVTGVAANALLACGILSGSDGVIVAGSSSKF